MRNRTYQIWGRLFAVLCLSGALQDVLADAGATPIPPEIGGNRERGFLPTNAIPDSLGLLPPPPADGSASFALDLIYAQKSFALRNTPAWALAIQDADLSFPNAASAYACALGVPVDEQHAPRLVKLLKKVKQDAGAATGAAKDRYKRPRPFMVNDAQFCTPDDRARLEAGGSYPSGHNAIGMAWGLILAELVPARADAILARAQAFGLSRVVCNVHWYSDTVWGRYLGAYTVAKLHADRHFQDDLSQAKDELDDLSEEAVAPNRDCVAERAGIEAQKPLTQ
ncbi:phosphatase PAP2 family protein [Methylococcaceae bacterium WWC4]|nr:phosphatase PAP2 family protein [Methylococcaceae bacterium WWC4]